MLQLAQSFGITPPTIEWDKSFSAKTLDEFLSLLDIEYHNNVQLDNMEDCKRVIPVETSLIFSNNVLEHIPLGILEKILSNCQYILSNTKKSLQLHHVDLSDHFSHMIPSLHPLNFYRFRESFWEALSRNSYAYTNRLTIYDFKLMLKKISTSSEIKILERVDFSKWPSAHLFCNKNYIEKEVDILKISIKISKNRVAFNYDE